MIKNIDGLSTERINYELQLGARFIQFGYCYSVIFLTVHSYSENVFFVKKGESTLKYSWPYTLLSVLLGWWGFPFGLIFTPWALYVNLTGGRDVTDDVLKWANESEENSGGTEQ